MSIADIKKDFRAHITAGRRADALRVGRLLLAGGQLSRDEQLAVNDLLAIYEAKEVLGLDGADVVAHANNASAAREHIDRTMGGGAVGERGGDSPDRAPYSVGTRHFFTAGMTKKTAQMVLERNARKERGE